MVRFLPFLISLALTVYALVSCFQTRSEDVRYLPKVIWAALIVVVPIAGAVAWLLLARDRGAPTRAATPGAKPRPPVRPVAPDDDPDFLASLERYRDPRTAPLPPELRRRGDASAPPEPGSAGQPGEAGATDAGDRGADEKTPDDKALHDKALDDKGADDKGPDDKGPDGRASDGRASDGSALNGGAPNGTAPNGLGPDRPTEHHHRGTDGKARNRPAANGRSGAGPEPEAPNPESPTDAEGGEGTRKP